MKRNLLIFAFVIACKLSDAQSWQPNGSTVLYTSGVNVGIGTSSPQELLHVSSSGPYPRISVQSTSTSGFPGFAIADNTGNEMWTWQYSMPNGYMSFFLSGVGNQMVITNTGTVGIGTDDPKGYKLAVNGSAVFTSAFVKPYYNWPDYVFRPEYRLRPLEDVASYIKANNHLPDIPSADSIQKAGIDLGGNQAALLKKIEELTLYLIEQDKKLEAQEKKINQLELLIRSKQN